MPKPHYKSQGGGGGKHPARGVCGFIAFACRLSHPIVSAPRVYTLIFLNSLRSVATP